MFFIAPKRPEFMFEKFLECDFSQLWVLHSLGGFFSRFKHLFMVGHIFVDVSSQLSGLYKVFVRVAS